MNSFINKYKEIDKDRYSRFLSVSIISLIILFMLGSFLKFKGLKEGIGALDVGAVMLGIKSFILYSNLARYVAILGIIALVIDWIAYKEERLYVDRLMSLSAVGLSAFVALMSGGALRSISRLMKSSDISDLGFNAPGSIGSLITLVRSLYLMEIAGVLLIIALIVSIYRLASGNVIAISQIGLSAEKKFVSTPVATTHSDQTNVVANGTSTDETLANEPSQVKTEVNVEELPQIQINKKVVGIVAGVIVFLMVSIFGYKFWDKNFNLTKVDLFENVVVTFDGISDEGYARYDVTFSTTGNATVDHFLDDVTFDFDKSNNLKNGDTIKLVSRIDVETAKRNKLKVGELSKEYTVEGLDEYLVSVDQMKNFTEIKEILSNELREDVPVLGYYFSVNTQNKPIILLAYAEEAYTFGSDVAEYNRIKYISYENLLVDTEGNVRGRVSYYSKSANYLGEKMSLEQVKEVIKTYGLTEIKE